MSFQFVCREFPRSRTYPTRQLRSSRSASLTLALLLAALCASSSPAADPATLLAARTLLLDAQTIGRSIVAVGAGGHILLSSDSGRTWQLAPTPTRATLTGVCFPDGQHGWAVGHDAIILHSEDGGRTWAMQYQGPDLQVSFLDVCFLDAQTGFVAGAYGQFLATTDGGRTWTPRRIIEEDYFLNRISLGPHRHAVHRGRAWHPAAVHRPRVDVGADPHAVRWLILWHSSPRREDASGPRPARTHLTGPRMTATPGSWSPMEQRGLWATAVRLRSGVIVVAGQSRLFAVSRDEGRSFAPWSPGLTTGVAELIEAPDGTPLAFGEDGATRLPAP